MKSVADVGGVARAGRRFAGPSGFRTLRVCAANGDGSRPHISAVLTPQVPLGNSSACLFSRGLRMLCKTFLYRCCSQPTFVPFGCSSAASDLRTGPLRFFSSSRLRSCWLVLLPTFTDGSLSRPACYRSLPPPLRTRTVSMVLFPRHTLPVPYGRWTLC